MINALIPPRKDSRQSCLREAKPPSCAPLNVGTSPCERPSCFRTIASRASAAVKERHRAPDIGACPYFGIMPHMCHQHRPVYRSMRMRSGKRCTIPFSDVGISQPSSAHAAIPGTSPLHSTSRYIVTRCSRTPG